MRVENGVTVYESFGELPNVTKRRKKQSTDKQREKFLGVCKTCKQPMVYIKGTNIIVCNNQNCQGYKNKNNKDDKYRPMYRIINNKNQRYLKYLFEEKDVTDN